MVTYLIWKLICILKHLSDVENNNINIHVLVILINRLKQQLMRKSKLKSEYFHFMLSIPNGFQAVSIRNIDKICSFE